MRNIKIKIGLFLSVLCILAMTSCEKNAVKEISVPPNGPLVKFYNFGIGAPAINFYVGEKKISAISSTSGEEAAGGTVYGGVYPSTGYSVVSGRGDISARTSSTAVPNPGITIATVNGSALEDGKPYSFYVTGTFNTTSLTADAFLLSDELPGNDTTNAFVRFVNAGTAEAGALSVTFTDQANPENPDIVVSTDLAFKSATEFKAIPRSLYTIVVKDNTSGMEFSRVGVSFGADRVYTLSMRGNINVTTGRLIDNTINR